jgi:hypothetical protein
MASEKIYIQSFDNITIVDPNKIINNDGFAEDRNVKQENLVVYANLEANLETRSRLIVGEKSGDGNLTQVSLGKLNFLKPNGENYLTTKWTELLPQTRESSNFTTELLGITSIIYRCNASFTPTVDITLEDTRGRALFESGDNSLYSVFFNLPYPIFYLTLKGHYGKAVRYQLILQKFQASFEQQTGNFIITLNFLTYKFNVLNDLQMGYLYAIPNMYIKEVTPNAGSISPSTNAANQINGNNQEVDVFQVFGGFNKIKEVYEIYKQKKLIDENFPELTLQQLIMKLENFEKELMEGQGEVNVDELTNAQNYKKIINEFVSEITGVSKESFKRKYLDLNKTYYLFKESGGVEVYIYKDTEKDKFKTVYTSLESTMTKWNSSLDNAPTFGENSKGSSEYKISAGININSVIGRTRYTKADIDVDLTAKKRFKTQNPTSGQTQTITDELNKIEFNQNGIQAKADEIEFLVPGGVPYFFRFEGDNSFLGEIGRVKKELESNTQKIQDKITKQITKILESSEKGIGFIPTIRNVTAIILASAEAFLRKMDDVHRQAFDSRNNGLKKSSCSDDVKKDANSPVYPFPQYGVTTTIDGQTKFELKYPGDPDEIEKTGAWDTSAWPEVEFVEEFVKGLVLRDQSPLNQNPQDNVTRTIKRILISGFDTPSNIPYSTLQIQKFYYELWERISLIARYQGFVRNEGFNDILNFIQASEATNVLNGVQTNNIDLIFQLKNYNLTSSNIIDVLYNISLQGVTQNYKKYERGEIVTEYLEEEILNSSKLFSEDLPDISQTFVTEEDTTKVEETIISYLLSTNKNKVDFTDTYPYAIKEWNIEYLSNGQQNNLPEKVLNVSETLFYNKRSKKIVNYNLLVGDIKPLTYFPSTNKVKIDYSLFGNGTADFYSNRVNSFYDYTEGKITTTSLVNGFDFTSSMLNTPFFIKSIQLGVELDKQNLPNPYVAASYLFLISLPLADLNFQYISLLGDKRNYIGPSLRKYGAVHVLPKLWVARIGAIWHRYKMFVEQNIDILSDSFTSFNYTENYDPVTLSPTKNYTFNTATIIRIKLNESQSVGTEISENYIFGFYPKVLNDFSYFLNNENLYEDVDSLQGEIQSKINSGDIKMIQNSTSVINKPAGYNPASPNNSLHIYNISILAKSKVQNLNNDESPYYFSLPSFGSKYNQVASECFSNGILTKPIDTNVYNGSIRLYWGGTHYGYFPTITQICSPTEVPKTKNDNQWRMVLNGSVNINKSTIDYLMATLTKEELDSFEDEFLKFSNRANDNIDGMSLQNILRKSLQVKLSEFDNFEEDTLVETFQRKQQSTFTDTLTKFMNQNFYFQKGNPTNFNYRIWAELSSTPSNFIKNPFETKTFVSTTPNSLPPLTSLANSELNYPQEWKALKLNVGFFEWNKFTYSDLGSYITDFFIDLNIAFTVENIQRYSEIIKIYATQKSIEFALPNFTSLFKQKMTDFLNRQNQLRNQIFDGVITKTKKFLPELNSTPNIDELNSKTTGNLTKLDYYDSFKAINDKWVAANNYNSETLFEDFLFFDRSNRDIGNELVVDIFSAVNFIKNTQAHTVYQILDSIIRSNNFTIFPMPTYINFYNFQDDEVGFANSLFGTFKEVDYTSSKSKIICQYTEKPSEHLKNSNPNNGYPNDGFDMNQTPNPLQVTDNYEFNKNLSNKVVGMNVDFGLQNQGVFKTIQVSQDLGKATSESLKAQFDTANLSKGVQAHTQSTSLFEIYKTRSYSSTITSFGNVMIQPTMYFNLRNVPLFAGTYLITDVEHSITPADFTTKFTGTRQKVFSIPKTNNFLDIIKTNFLDKFISDVVTKQEIAKTQAENILEGINSLNSSLNTEETPSSNPNCQPNVEYQSGYLTVTSPSKQTLSVSQVQKTVRDKCVELGNPNRMFLVYTIFYINSFDKVSNNFVFYENNPAQIPLTINWGGDLNNLLKKSFMCLVNSDGENQAYANFDTLENCVEFVFNKYGPSFTSTVQNGNEEQFVTGFTKNFVEKFPTSIVTTAPGIFEQFKTNNPSDYQILQDLVRASWKSVTTYKTLNPW